MTDYTGKKVLVRGVQSGVYFGTLAYRDGQECELTIARNIWRWHGANNLTELAQKGVRGDGDNRFSAAVDSIVLTDVCEIVPCTDLAVERLEAIDAWEYQR